MNMASKTELKNAVANCVKSAKEIRKVVVFGSFLDSEFPQDMDLAIFQDSQEEYLPLALKYRRMARSVSRRIPLDIIPIRSGASGSMMNEINRGEVVFER